MFPPRVRKLQIIAVFLFLAVMACNLPKNNTTATQDPGFVYTVAAKTLESEITEVSKNGESTPLIPTTQPAPVPTNTANIPTQTPVPLTFTPVPSLSATSIPCDFAEFVDDVTIDDGTEISPGEPFEKIWRLKNIGSCTWTTEYDLIFDSGTQMGAPDSKQLTTSNVNAGQTIDISVNLVAPDDPGEYRGYFNIQNPGGKAFGLGEKSNPFWVEITVPDQTGVQLDFLVQARNADWGSGSEPVDFANPGHIELSYGGPDTNEDGFVMIKDHAQLESGRISGKILQTHPKWVENGYIIGKYPAYKVRSGDFLKGQLGFIAQEDGSCGNGEVIFEIHSIIDNDLGSRSRLGQWPKSCDGKLTSFELDLSDLSGEQVNFYLLVLANGSSAQDWAIWSSLGVMR